MKIYITRSHTTDMVFAGIYRCKVWFNKPPHFKGRVQECLFAEDTGYGPDEAFKESHFVEGYDVGCVTVKQFSKAFPKDEWEIIAEKILSLVMVAWNKDNWSDILEDYFAAVRSQENHPGREVLDCLPHLAEEYERAVSAEYENSFYKDWIGELEI